MPVVHVLKVICFSLEKKTRMTSNVASLTGLLDPNNKNSILLKCVKCLSNCL